MSVPSAQADDQSNSIQVSLSGGAQLPQALVQDIETAVRLAVFTELAGADLGPGYRITDLDAESTSGAITAADTNVGLVIVIHVGH